MDDIARRAGISKKTLYQHFANKHEVVNESVQWYKNRLCDNCEAVISESENAIEAFVRTQLIMDQVYKQTNPATLMEMQRYFPEAYESFKQRLMDVDLVMIKEILQRGINEGLFRPEINTDLMARYRLETSLMMFQTNLVVNERYDMLFITHEICEHFLYGIMTAKGEKQYLKFKDKYLKPATK